MLAHWASVVFEPVNPPKRASIGGLNFGFRRKLYKPEQVEVPAESLDPGNNIALPPLVVNGVLHAGDRNDKASAATKARPILQGEVMLGQTLASC